MDTAIDSSVVFKPDTISPAAQKMRDFYDIKPDAPIHNREFGWFCLDKWISQGYLKPYDKVENWWGYLNELFMFDASGVFGLGQLGWCEAAMMPYFEEKVLEDRGDHELAQDYAGRHVLFFKGRRSGFMPEYVKHPVSDMKSFEENIKWRLDPKNPKRYESLERRMRHAQAAARNGCLITQNLVGAYMYLRSLIGPADLLYTFYDQPELIHACMEAWFNLADTVIEQHQRYVVLDEIFFGEDICYKNGCLISPEMMDEFLMPYYQQLLTNARKRQLDSRTLHVQIDTDGFADPVIPIYQRLGMDTMSPFEVAANCDVVRTAREYPELRIYGGIDKRILSAGKESIDRELDRIMPVMRRRGGYIPTCDHGVPEEVDFEDYMHYRVRMKEYCG